MPKLTEILCIPTSPEKPVPGSQECFPPPGNPCCCPEVSLDQKDNIFTVEDDYDNTISLTQEGMSLIIEDIKNLI